MAEKKKYPKKIYKPEKDLNEQGKRVNALPKSTKEHKRETLHLLVEGVSHYNIVKQLSTKYEVHQSTVEYWIKAVKPEADFIREEREAFRRKAIQDVEEELHGVIKSDLELEAYVSQIAAGNVRVEDWVKGEAVLRGVQPNEIIKAVELLWKKRGTLAPLRVAKTNSKGEDLPPLDLSNLTDDELKFLAAIEGKIGASKT